MSTIAEGIKQRRLQMLVHSYIYYELDLNIVSDSTWAKWAKELQQLQDENPDIASKVIWAEAFKDWDGSSGAYLPLNDPWVVSKAHEVLAVHERKPTKPQPIKKPVKQQTLF